MHARETDSGTGLVRRLIAAQFPDWAELPVRRIASNGTVNDVYRLGDDLAVRLPQAEGGSRDAVFEHRWLPLLARHLPLAVPVPLALGAPAEGYPFNWTVCRWIEGDNPAAGTGDGAFAVALAEFVLTLRSVDTTGGPPAYRSEPLAARDAATGEALDALHGVVDTRAAAAVWAAALAAPAPQGPPVWVHGDLQPGNVLVSEGRLGAVIDFGCMGLADPAVDLIAGWYLLPAVTRRVFRARTGADGAQWARGRGWALSVALMELSYYRTSNPVMAATARHVIGEILDEGDG
ncbi:aminoglycoside phosphotransferase family protein [Streptomyces sp. NPDC048305]|uniref:aminoglycoside phosphotransferase family protein n=1 Tax=Streptomyces sp. NPDC048305 TaxID=3365532 RepID=UPI003715C638